MSEDISMNELFRLGQSYIDKEKTEHAIHYLELAAQCGHPEAQFQLSNQLSMDQQEDLSLDWLIEADSNGYGPASRTLIMYFWKRDTVTSNEIDEVIDWYRDSENNWRGDRMLELAEFLFYLKRKNEGLAELRKAALLDNAEACRRLGLLHFKNQIANSNFDEGLSWLTKAADLGNGWAAEELSELYLKGERSKFFPDVQVTTDKVQAIRLLERNVSWGFNYSAYTLALLYLEGTWVEADYVLAEKWFLKAANSNVSFAQTKLADEYISGEKFPCRIFEAAHWYRRAADRDPSAVINLCMLLASDRIGPPNFKECFNWFSYLLNQDPLNVKRVKSLFDLLSDGRFADDLTDSFSIVVKKRFFHQLEIVNNCVDKSELGSAAYKLSQFYLHGLGTSADQTHYLFWLKKSAEQGLYIAKDEFEKMSIS